MNKEQGKSNRTELNHALQKMLIKILPTGYDKME